MLGCQFSSGHFLLNVLQKIIIFLCWRQKIHCIRWRLRVASVCILAYRSVGIYCQIVGSDMGFLVSTKSLFIVWMHVGSGTLRCIILIVGDWRCAVILLF